MAVSHGGSHGSLRGSRPAPGLLQPALRALPGGGADRQVGSALSTPFTIYIFYRLRSKRRYLDRRAM